MSKKILTLFLALALWLGAVFVSSLNLEKLCEEIVDIYKANEVPQKKERMVYKKLADMISQSYTVTIICSDSIAYNKQNDYSTIKSKEIYYVDAKTGYFGIFVIVDQNGDNLLMNSSPDKEMTLTGTLKDIIVIGYVKDNLNKKCYTPIKEFEDSGTVIQRVILKIQA